MVNFLSQDDGLPSNLSLDPNSRTYGSVSAVGSSQTTTRRADDPQPQQDDVPKDDVPCPQPSDPNAQQAVPSSSVLGTNGTSVQEHNTGMAGGTASDCVIVGKMGVGATVIVYSELVEEIKKRTNTRIEEWTRNMVDTSALAALMEKLSSGVTWVTVNGQPGEGKTTAAYMALKKLQQSGRKVFQVLLPGEFTEVIKTCHQPVIMLDDILGDLDFDRAKWSLWKTVIDDILGERQHTSHENTSKKDDVTVIFVCRNYLLNNVSCDLGKIAEYFTDDNHMVSISKSGDRPFSEKENILKSICDSKDYKIDEETTDTICNADSPHGFPHTCRLYVTFKLDDLKIDVVNFMKSPLEFLNQTVQKFIQDSTKLLLFKEMVKRDGKITIREIESLEKSYVVSTLVYNLLDSYLRKEEDCFSFHHSSIYDSVSFNLTKYFPGFVIKHCSLSFLHERVRLVPSCDSQLTIPKSLLVVNIPRSYIKDLTVRFAPEIASRKLMLVLSHKALTDQQFTEELMSCITLPLTELLTLTDKQTDESFLSLVASSKSPHLLKYLEKKDIQLIKGNINTVLYGVYRYAASDVLTYLVHSCYTFDINVRYEYDITPLMIGSKTRDSQFVKQLISLGADLKAKDSDLGRTVLHYLCEYGLAEVLREVIKGGEDINVKSYWSLLNWACNYNQVEVARVLQKNGAKIDAKTVVEACRDGSLDAIKLLFEFGAKVEMATNNTLLTAACRWGRIKVMKFLIEKGASVNTVDAEGLSPLQRAYYHNKPQVVLLLLNHGVEISSRYGLQGNTLLHIAAGWGNTGIIDVLVKDQAGIDTKCTNVFRQTPLHTAMHYEFFAGHICSGLCLPDISVCQTLINRGAEINKQDILGNTPLHLLCHVDSQTTIHKDLVYKDYLHDQPASVYKDVYRCLAILLVEHGAEREIKNIFGVPALHGWCKTLTDQNQFEMKREIIYNRHQ